MRRFRLSCACANYHRSLCSPFVHSLVSNDSVSGQWRPWSDCACAQTDVGLRRPLMPEDTLSHGAATHVVCGNHKNSTVSFMCSFHHLQHDTDVHKILCYVIKNGPFTIGNSEGPDWTATASNLIGAFDAHRYSSISIHSTSGPRMSRSDCAYAQAYLSIRCPHWDKSLFSWHTHTKNILG